MNRELEEWENRCSLRDRHLAHELRERLTKYCKTISNVYRIDFEINNILSGKASMEIWCWDKNNKEITINDTKGIFEICNKFLKENKDYHVDSIEYSVDGLPNEPGANCWLYSEDGGELDF